MESSLAVIFVLGLLGVLAWAWIDLRRLDPQHKNGKSVQANIDSLSQPNQQILITGGTGFIGKPLVQMFIDQGHQVTLLTRDVESAASLFPGRLMLVDSLDLIENHEFFDVVINLAGETISQRWSVSSKEKILESRIQVTASLVALVKRLVRKPSIFISGSAIGIYGTEENMSFVEDTPASRDATGAFPREVCEKWERVAHQMEACAVRTCFLRTGVVLETDGGALAKMRFPFEIGLGGSVGTGTQWFSWIHRADLIRLIVYLINTKSIKGAVNATAPEPVTNKVFSRALGKAMSRPTFFPLPAFQVKLLFGAMGETLLLSGQKVQPHKAIASGFSFHFPNIDTALQQIFAKP